MTEQTTTEARSIDGAASELDVELGRLRDIAFAAEALRAHIVYHGEANTKDLVFLDFNEAMLAWTPNSNWARKEKRMHHDLKILPPYFEAVIDGRKTFEIRKDDRGFQAGDTVTLKEYDPEHKGYYRSEEQMYTGRTHGAVIGYVTAYEQQPGYVVFSLRPNVELSGDPLAGRPTPTQG